MSEPQRGVSPPVAVAFAVVGFFALLIAGFGLLSLLSDAEVIPVPGLGQLPGAIGTWKHQQSCTGSSWPAWAQALAWPQLGQRALFTAAVR